MHQSGEHDIEFSANPEYECILEYEVHSTEL